MLFMMITHACSISVSIIYFERRTVAPFKEMKPLIIVVNTINILIQY